MIKKSLFCFPIFTSPKAVPFVSGATSANSMVWQLQSAKLARGIRNDICFSIESN